MAGIPDGADLSFTTLLGVTESDTVSASGTLQQQWGLGSGSGVYPPAVPDVAPQAGDYCAGTYVVMLGVVPLVLTPCVEINVTLSATGKIGVTSSTSFLYGEEASWSSTDPDTLTLTNLSQVPSTNAPPSTSVLAAGEGSLGLDVKPELFLYGVTGPYINASIALVADISPTAQPWFTLDLQLGIAAGWQVVIDFLGIDVQVQGSATLSWTLYRSTGPPPVSLAPPLSVSPPTATVAPGASQEFSAPGVSGAVTWTLAGAAGDRISSVGLFTAAAPAGRQVVVTATDSTGATGTAIVTIGPGIGPPQSLAGTVNASGTAASLTWKPPVVVTGETIASYSVSTTPAIALVSVAGTATGTAITGLTPGTTYVVSVSAWTTSGFESSPATLSLFTAQIPTWSMPEPVPLRNAYRKLACASASFCMALGGGTAPFEGEPSFPLTWSEWNGSRWSTSQNAPSSGPLSGLACPSSTFCMTWGRDDAMTFDGSSWSTPKPVPVQNAGPSNGVSYISCPASGFCLGLDLWGHAVLYSAGAWSLASVGCRNAMGALPMAQELERLLLAELGITNIDEPVGLQRAYEQAEAQLGAPFIREFLQSRFAGATPSSWHLLIPRLRWPCIWTFNIDDVIESAYGQCTERAQLRETVLWKDRPRPLDGLSEAVPIAHLHGYVGTTPSVSDPQLVFSVPEYLAAMQSSSRSTWQTTFRSYFPSYPVIIIGARLAEEIDFAEIVRQGNTALSYGRPSIVVLPSISDFQRSEFERWGLTPVVCTGEAFLNHLVAGVDQRSAVMATSSLYSSLYTERTLCMRADPSVSPPLPASTSHDFYGGHEPDWSDITRDLDAVPRWVERLVNEIGPPERVPTVQLCYVLCGEPFTGKSTGLLRLERELQTVGWEPIHLIGWERLDTEEVLKYFADRPRAVLFVDPVWFDANELDRLLRSASTKDQRLLIIGTDRTRRLQYIKNVLSLRFLIGAVTPVVEFDITDGLWWAIVRRRRLHARLGRLEGVGEAEAKLYFVERGRDLYSALAQLEDANGFVERGVEVFSSLTREQQTAFAVISLVGSVGLPVPSATIAAVAGLRVVKLIESLGPAGALGEWVAIDRHQVGVVRLRHQYLGELVVSGRVALPEGVSFLELALGVCLAIAGRVSVEAIRQGTLEYRIAAELMDEKLVKRLAGSSEVDSWYASLEESYRWNARYWEQRALAQDENLDRAYSFAQRALQLRRDGFTLNTLGTVLMRRAVIAFDEGSVSAAEGYWRNAVDVLASAREDFRGRLEPPFSAFFAYTGRFFTGSVSPEGVWATTIRQAFDDWLAAARAADVLRDPDIARLLEHFPPGWVVGR